MNNNPFNGYDLSRTWFDYCLDNAGSINPNHHALYFFCVEWCNRLGWASKFGMPTEIAMHAMGVKNWRTYKSTLDDLVAFGFIKLYEVSKNQYTANVIGLVKKYKASTTTHTKASAEARTKAKSRHCSHNKTNKTNKTIKPINNTFEFINILDGFSDLIIEWLEYKRQIDKIYTNGLSLIKFYNQLIKYCDGNLEVATSIINKSIANQWKGIFMLPENEKTAVTDKSILNPTMTREEREKEYQRKPEW